MARPTASTRVRKIAAHNGASATVAATLYDDDMAGANALDRAIANDRSPHVNGTLLSVTGKTWTNVAGEWQWV